ncbi:MAG: hypothetical protein KDC85_05310 [Saprospiraceae bacterium]|nr:hypothetical protein [Saprospiraceae bacterium]MCB9324983.1 hypothetical protein [Lewinellaceae bacterium]
MAKVRVETSFTLRQLIDSPQLNLTVDTYSPGLAIGQIISRLNEVFNIGFEFDGSNVYLNTNELDDKFVMITVLLPEENDQINGGNLRRAIL